MDWIIEPADPEHPDAVAVLRGYFAEISARYYGREVTDDDVTAAMAEEPSRDLRPPSGLLLLARRDRAAVGCVGLRLRSPGVAELKRMFVDAGARRGGLAGVSWRRSRRPPWSAGCTPSGSTREPTSRTRGRSTPRSATARSAYNENKHAEHWFERRLVSVPAG